MPKVFYRSASFQRKRLAVILILLLFSSLPWPSISSCQHSGAALALPDLDKEAYIQLGDINIGYFVLATGPTSSGPCPTAPLSGSATLEYTEAVAYAVKSVNEDPNLLPNVTLGFVQVNDCGNGNVALTKALSFLPRISRGRDSDSVCNASADSNNTQFHDNVGVSEEVPYYDVIGVISPTFSEPAALVSRLFAGAQLPIVGCSATSDELSIKSRHPYFLRIVSADRNMVKAMLSFIANHEWSYISVIYAYGDYGEKAFDNIRSEAPLHGICVATSHRVDTKTDFDDVVNDLLNYPRARVVILFCYIPEITRLFYSINKRNATGHFFWIGGHGWSNTLRADFKLYERDALGSFSFYYHTTLIPEFFEYVRQLDVPSSLNPWLKPVWENLADCSFSNNTCSPDLDILMTKDFGFTRVTSFLVDGVKLFAQAAHNLLADLCPGMTGAEARACINGETLLGYLRNISMQGRGGLIHFDSFGDPLGKYEIRQVSYGSRDLSFVDLPSTEGLEERIVGFYDIQTGQITHTEVNISWDHLLQVDRVVPLPKGDTMPYVPESVCSRPCVPGEYRIQKEPECCWECRRCRDNEQLIHENTSCKACETFTWPDPDTSYTTCRAIPVTYSKISDTIPLIQIVITIAALICTTVVIAAYIRFRNLRVIKASSKELSILQMVAIVLGYLTVIVFQLTPEHNTCAVQVFMFCLSFTWLYSPLIIKAVRVYRIFLGDAKHNRKPRFFSPQSQIIMAGILILIQILLCVVTYVVYAPTAKKSQPVPTEKFVELSCDLPLTSLVSFLTYNLLLITLSLLLAFKTRKLPDNFNESWFIFMCASTTLVIWLAFIPTYFTAGREFIRSMLLSMALFLNHTVALIFLFLPKVYAAVCVPQENSDTTRSTGISNASAASRGRIHWDNRVHPTPEPPGNGETEH